MGVNSDSQFKYRALTSYSLQDRNWGDWLPKAIEIYHVQKQLAGRTRRNRAHPMARALLAVTLTGV